MSPVADGGRFIIAVTGAQGVGKSTFCRALRIALVADGYPRVTLCEGIGDAVRALGLEVGSAAGRDGIAAIYAAHIQRETDAPGGVVVLDRCVVDALAYVRGLAISSAHERRLYEEISRRHARMIDLVVHLSMTGRFATSTASHETTALRSSVAREIEWILKDFGVPQVRLAADDGGAVDEVVRYARSTEAYR